MVRDDLKAEASNLGFSILGITTPDPPAHFSAYQGWIDQGCHAGMDYLASPTAIEKRGNLARLMSSARVVISLAMPYSNPTSLISAGPGRGRVASYAWGDDYHPVISKRIEALSIAINRLVGKPIRQRGFSDTSPILERDLAQCAGLGWIGKNTCLIHPHLGSYFFLAELLLELELDPDPPFIADRCGLCQRCIQACPTGCIQANRTIDARRCISFLTIENKGGIPKELRPQIGNWIFGCDVCQLVCPWNQSARGQATDPAFNPRQGVSNPLLIDELSLDPDRFNHHFLNSPIQRALRRGYLRNVAVAMGNQPDPGFLPVLSETLSSEPDPLIRAHAAWAVRQIDGSQANQLLNQIRSSETNPIVLAECAE